MSEPMRQEISRSGTPVRSGSTAVTSFSDTHVVGISAPMSPKRTVIADCVVPSRFSKPVP